MKVVHVHRRARRRRLRAPPADPAAGAARARHRRDASSASTTMTPIRSTRSSTSSACPYVAAAGSTRHRPRARRPAAAARSRAPRPDIVHTHLVHADVYGGSRRRPGDRRSSSTKHNDDPFRLGPFRHVERLLRPPGDADHRHHRRARPLQRRARRPAGRQGRRSSTTASTTCRLRGGRPAARRSRPMHGSCSPSRGSRSRRGSNVAIEALAGVRRAASQTPSSWSSGRGSQEAALTALAAAARRRRRRLPRRQRRRRGGLARGGPSMLVHPARWEGFGLALLEAMLARLPIVASARQRDPRDRRRRRRPGSSSRRTTFRVSARRSAASSTTRRSAARTATPGTSAHCTLVLGRDDGRADDRRLPRGARAARSQSRTTASAHESTE